MLGLIGEGTGIAAKVLKSMGASPVPPRPRHEQSHYLIQPRRYSPEEKI